MQSPPWFAPELGEATAGSCAERLMGASLLGLGSICLPRALIMGPPKSQMLNYVRSQKWKRPVRLPFLL